jgi:AbrB family looped-hinge helix DNA binding protein
MSAVLDSPSTVSSKGQVTLPVRLREQLGLVAGSRIRFELRGKEIVITPELPISAYRGLLKGYAIPDTEIPKESDRF